MITLMVALVLGHMWLLPAKVTGMRIRARAAGPWRCTEHNLAHVRPVTGTAGNKAAAAIFKVYQSPHVTSCGALEAHTPLLVSRGEPRLVVS